MDPDDEPSIVSLEQHRRKRLAESRKRTRAKVRPPHERAINWRRTPMVLAALALFLLFSWLMRHVGALSPFH